MRYCIMVKQFDKFYEVSDLGEVYSVSRISNGKRYSGKRIKPRDCGRGLQVHCHLSTGEDKFLLVDRLVFATFNDITLTEDDNIIHLDGDLYNNKLENLALGVKIRNEHGHIKFRPKIKFED